MSIGTSSGSDSLLRHAVTVHHFVSWLLLQGFPLNLGPNVCPSTYRLSVTLRNDLLALHWTVAGLSIALRSDQLVMDAAVAVCCTLPGDDVYQPFEPELDWASFAVRIPEDQIPHIHEVLENMSEEEYQRRRVSGGRLAVGGGCSGHGGWGWRSWVSTSTRRSLTLLAVSFVSEEGLTLHLVVNFHHQALALDPQGITT